MHAPPQPVEVLADSDFASGGALRKRLRPASLRLLRVPELTSRTVELTCPHELQRRSSQPQVSATVTRRSTDKNCRRAPLTNHRTPRAPLTQQRPATTVTGQARCVVLLGRREGIAAPAFPPAAAAEPPSPPTTLLHNLGIMREAASRAEVSRPNPPWTTRSMLTEIYLCRACSCHEDEGGTPGQVTIEGDGGAPVVVVW